LRLIRNSLVLAALVVGVPAAHAATLGTVEFQAFIHTSTDYRADLGGITPVLPDALVIFNDYNGMLALPGGLPANYDIHIPATFRGDFNAATADAFDDRFLFKVDGTTTGGQTTATGDNYLNLIVGPNTGLDNAVFAIFENTGDGDLAGPALGSRNGSGQLLVGGLDTSKDYLLRVTGNLRADNPNTLGNESTNVGQYKIVLALTPVPVPPALILLMTAVGAMFGVGRLKRRSALGMPMTA
jgi:hypothetical protein